MIDATGKRIGIRRHLCTLIVCGVLAIAAVPAGYTQELAQDSAPEPGPGRAEPLPDALAGVGITEQLDHQIPLDARFRDEEGREVTLGDYFNQGKPVILNLMYMSCPMLCGLVGNALSDAMKELTWTAGDEFTVLSVSFDHTEKPTLAKLKKINYVESLGRPSAARGWHFLTGDEEPVKRLTEAVGFSFRWIEPRQEFAHAAAIMVLTPAGKVSRYLYGVQYDPQTLRLSLVEAADGKIGTTKDRFLLFCFHYDATTGRYGPAAQRLMQAGGVVTVAALSIMILSFWRRGKRDQDRAA